jgi:hypothetical protein
MLARETNASCPRRRVQIGVGLEIGIGIVNGVEIGIEWVCVNGFRFSAIGATRFGKKLANIAYLPTIPIPIPIPTPKKANGQYQQVFQLDRNLYEGG